MAKHARFIAAAVLLTISTLTYQGAAVAADRGLKAGASASASKLGTPRGSIAHQLALLKKGDVAALRACFTARQQKRITASAVARAQKQAQRYRLSDLVASVTRGSYRGRQTAKIKMKNGRTLTTLILIQGQWLADTVWFR